MNPIPHYGGYIVDIKQPHISKYYNFHTGLLISIKFKKTNRKMFNLTVFAKYINR